MTGGNLSKRPIIFDYLDITQFLRDMIQWRSIQEPHFSIRNQTQKIPGLSQSLVSHIVRGKRTLTRDRVLDFAEFLNLNSHESKYLDQWVTRLRRRSPLQLELNTPSIKHLKRASVSNSILNHWLNLYVKDAFGLKSVIENPNLIDQILFDIAPAAQIKKSLQFLLKEGFLRRTLSGGIVKNEDIAITSGNVSSAKIRAFHIRALKIAQAGIHRFSPEQRRANTLLMALDEASLSELKLILEEFYERLISFMERHPNEGTRLYQVIINLCPIGGSHVTCH